MRLLTAAPLSLSPPFASSPQRYTDYSFDSPPLDDFPKLFLELALSSIFQSNSPFLFTDGPAELPLTFPTGATFFVIFFVGNRYLSRLFQHLRLFIPFSFKFTTSD